MKLKVAIVVLALLAAGAFTLWLGRHQSPVPAIPANENVTTEPVIPPLAVPPPRQPTVQSPRLQSLLGSAGEPFASRSKAIRSLKGPFTREEVESLYAFLRTPSARPGTSVQEEHALKNDVMNKLARQQHAPPDLLSNLCDLCRGGQQDTVTRDYALQHIVALCLKGTNHFAADRAVAMETLWRTMPEADGSLAGTALLGLHRLSVMDSSVDAGRVSDAALKLARDPTAGELSRSTAFQVCAERRIQDGLPDVVRTAQESRSLPLRLSAIAAVGRLGGEPELALLRAWREGGEEPVRVAVAAACRCLEERLVPPATPSAARESH